MIKHLAPKQSLTDAQSDYSKFILGLSQEISLKDYGINFSPYPIKMPSDFPKRVKSVTQVLVKAIYQIVNNYLSDSAIR